MSTLSAVYMYTYTHTISFSLGKQLPGLFASKLLPASSTATWHKSACTQPAPELRAKCSSMCCMSHLYMHLSDDILFLAGIKPSRACYLLGMSLFPSPANQQGSVQLASLFFEQTTKSPEQSQPVQRQCSSLWLESLQKKQDILCKISEVTERSLPASKMAKHSITEHLDLLLDWLLNWQCWHSRFFF